MLEELKDRLPNGLRGDAARLLRRAKTLVRQAWFARHPRLDLSGLTGHGLLLHIGSGDRVIAGWINIDISNAAGTYFADLRDPLSLGAGCAVHIHCEHVVEHLTLEEAQRFLRECWRLLQTGGSLRIIVPDAGKYLRAYALGDLDFFAPISRLGGAASELRTRMEIINQMFRMGGDHRFAWDFETLELVLRESGFERVEESAAGAVAAPLNIDGDDWWRLHESLYVNAYKAR